MAFTFRKRIRLLPGIYLNLGKKSASISVKAGPVSLTRSTTGQRTVSADLPGPLGYRKTSTKRSRNAKRAQRRNGGDVWE